MERTEGVEPSPPTLEGGALPMSYIRVEALARARPYGNQKLLLGLIPRRAGALATQPIAPIDTPAKRRSRFKVIQGDLFD